MLRPIVILLALTSLLSAAGRPVFAHVFLEQEQAPANSDYKAVFHVPHGCDGSPTIRMQVRMPPGTSSVKPEPKPGWQLEVVNAKLVPPLDDGHAGKSGEVVEEVSWSGGSLLDTRSDEFVIVMRLPDRPGATLYFPVVQQCAQGVHRWIEIPEAGKPADDYREPAPALRLAPAR